MGGRAPALPPPRNGSRSDVTLAIEVEGSSANVRHVERGLDLRAVLVVSEGDGEGERLLGSLSQLVTAVGEEEARPRARDRPWTKGCSSPAAWWMVVVVPAGLESAQAVVEGEPSTTWTARHRPGR